MHVYPVVGFFRHMKRRGPVVARVVLYPQHYEVPVHCVLFMQNVPILVCVQTSPIATAKKSTSFMSNYSI